MAGIIGEESPGGLFGGTESQSTTTATAEQSKIAAEASEAAAAASASTASTQATNASNSASTASTQASNASSSATASANSATASANSATAAASSASGASSSASTATTKANTATTQANTATTKATLSTNNAADAGKYAVHAEDSQFTLADGSTQGYSALHWSAKAEDHKTAAAASASTASTQASNASSSASSANSSASTATTKANTATTQASNASSSATAASNSASSLSSSVNKLATVETNADVTDTANVTNAGALMDSELTNLAAVKAINQSLVTSASPTFAGLTTTADVSFADSDKAKLGTGNDMQLYHDGTNSYVTNSTGILKVATEASGIAVEIGHTTSEVTIRDNLTITGNLTINGDTVTAASTNTTIADNLIELNSGVSSNANDSGIIIERGSTGNNAIFMWDESADKFVVGTTTATASSTGNLTVAPASLQADVVTFGSISDGSITATAFVDEDDMTSNSATLIPTQQSVKTYADGQALALAIALG